MNNLLDNVFEQTRAAGRGVLITYFPMGEPGFDPVELAGVYAANGAQVLEVGFPVPEATADGAVIQASMRRIIDSGFGMDDYFRQIRRVKDAHPQLSLQVFAYSALLDRMGLADFSKACGEVGVDSVLLADASIELNQTLDRELPTGVHAVRFMPFGLTPDNVEDCAANAHGYVFFQATEGVTGMRDQLDPELPERFRLLREQVTTVPLCPGFGISTPDQARAVIELGADGLIVGSLMVKTLHAKGMAGLGSLLRGFQAAVGAGPETTT